MTTFEKIVNAIQQFGMPYAPDIYEGGSSEGWFTYNYADDYGEAFADDEPEASIATVQVHLFLPLNINFTSLKNQVRNALSAEGFSYAHISYFTEDNTWRHIVFESSILEEDAIE